MITNILSHFPSEPLQSAAFEHPKDAIGPVCGDASSCLLCPCDISILQAALALSSIRGAIQRAG